MKTKTLRTRPTMQKSPLVTRRWAVVAGKILQMQMATLVSRVWEVVASLTLPIPPKTASSPRSSTTSPPSSSWPLATLAMSFRQQATLALATPAVQCQCQDRAQGRNQDQDRAQGRNQDQVQFKVLNHHLCRREGRLSPRGLEMLILKEVKVATPACSYQTCQHQEGVAALFQLDLSTRHQFKGLIQY